MDRNNMEKLERYQVRVDERKVVFCMLRRKHFYKMKVNICGMQAMALHYIYQNYREKITGRKSIFKSSKLYGYLDTEINHDDPYHNRPW